MSSNEVWARQVMVAVRIHLLLFAMPSSGPPLSTQDGELGPAGPGGTTLLDVLRMTSMEGQRSMRQILPPALCKPLRLACPATRDWADQAVSKLGITLAAGTSEEELRVAQRLGRPASALRPSSLHIKAGDATYSTRAHTLGSSLFQHPGLQHTLSRLTSLQLEGVPASEGLLSGLTRFCPSLARIMFTNLPEHPVSQGWELLRQLQGLRSLYVSSNSTPTLWDSISSCPALTSVAVYGRQAAHCPTSAQLGSLAAVSSLFSLSFRSVVFLGSLNARLPHV